MKTEAKNTATEQQHLYGLINDRQKNLKHLVEVYLNGGWVEEANILHVIALQAKELKDFEDELAGKEVQDETLKAYHEGYVDALDELADRFEGWDYGDDIAEEALEYRELHLGEDVQDEA